MHLTAIYTLTMIFNAPRYCLLFLKTLDTIGYICMCAYPNSRKRQKEPVLQAG